MADLGPRSYWVRRLPDLVVGEDDQLEEFHPGYSDLLGSVLDLHRSFEPLCRDDLGGDVLGDPPAALWYSRPSATQITTSPLAAVAGSESALKGSATGRRSNAHPHPLAG